MVPHEGSKRGDTCLDTEHRQKDALPPLHLPWHPEAEHTDAGPGNGAEELLLKPFFSRSPENTVCYPTCRLEVGSVGRSLAGAPVGMVLSSH